MSKRVSDLEALACICVSLASSQGMEIHADILHAARAVHSRLGETPEGESSFAELLRRALELPAQPDRKDMH